MFRSPFSPLSLFLPLVFVFMAGCSTVSGPGAESVTVNAHSGLEVEGAANAVFQDHGYTEMGSKNNVLTYEKPGSKTDQMLYGDFEDSRMTDRVKVTIDPLDNGSRFRLTAVAFAVRQPTGHFAGDTSFEDPIRRLQVFSSQLEHILSEIKARLH